MPKAQSRWHHLYCDVAEARKASGAFAATVRNVLERGHINAAAIADHIEPHKGNQQNSSSASFGRFVSYTTRVAKKREEARGYSTAIGADGWPVDPRHPVYSRGPGGHEIFSEA